MNIKALVTAACLTVASAMPGYAVTVDYDGDTYEVTTIFGSFDDNQGQLMGQVWWGDAAVAVDFAVLVADQLGVPNGSFVSFGPYFAWLLTDVPSFAAGCWDDLGNGPLCGGLSPDEQYTFAIASPVPAIPLPASAVLMLAGLGGLAALRRKQKPTA